MKVGAPNKVKVTVTADSFLHIDNKTIDILQYLPAQTLFWKSKPRVMIYRVQALCTANISSFWIVDMQTVDMQESREHTELL